MKSTRVEKSILGNQIGKAVYGSNGNMLLNKGVVVNNKVLAKLMNHNVNYIYIEDPLSDGIEPEGIIEEKQMVGSISTVKKVFEDVMKQEKQGVRAVIPEDHLKLVEEIINSLMESLESAEDILYTVVDLIGTDEYTYKHSVNVAVLSILTAKALEYSYEDIKSIALGAILHDIGKVRVNIDLIKKPGKLTQEERKEVERHPQLGYELVQNVDSIPYSTKQIIRLHHEKLDGSGYPLGLRGFEVPQYVRIVTICDMYDAMTTDRVYRSRMPIYKALDILMGEAVYKIDRNIYKFMTNNICIFPPGLGVVLSDGRLGVIASYKAQNPSRPQVRVLTHHTENRRVEVQVVNLEDNRSIFIEDTWDVEGFMIG